jgi:hypothetical protein
MSGGSTAQLELPFTHSVEQAVLGALAEHGRREPAVAALVLHFMNRLVR